MQKPLLFILGCVSLAVGTIGIFLPVLPTTVFLLITAWCWLRSSERFYRWLTTNRVLGPYIVNYREQHGMAYGHKIFTIALLWAGIGCTVVFFVERIWLAIVLLGIAVSVTIHIHTLKTIAKRRPV